MRKRRKRARRPAAYASQSAPEARIATISHELRTPLTSLSASLGLLAGNPTWRLPPAARRLVAIAYANSERLIRLVNDLLDIETMQSGKAAFEVKRVSLGALVEEAIDVNYGFAESCGVRLRLVATADDCAVDVDPDRFVQALTNLLSNAVKYSPPEADVDVIIEPRPHSVRIAVRDYGPGIPEDFKPRVFEEFARAASLDGRRRTGAGLGLSIAKTIVGRLGGTLTFADAAGGGTVFFLELPSAAAAGRERLEPRPAGTRHVA